MKIVEKKYTLDPVANEGIETLDFIKNELIRLDIDISKLDILEIGPKHGNHTRFLDFYNPKSLCCLELQIKTKEAAALMKSIKNIDTTTLKLDDLMSAEFDKKFDLILFTGVIYHNIDQIGMLRKLWSVANPNAIMFFESSTTRTQEYRQQNVIEVHWPNTYRDTTTIRMLPSKKACLSMLEMTGWELLASDEAASYDRIKVTVKRTEVPVTAYKTI